MAPVMMPAHGTVPFIPFARHMPGIAVSAPPAGVATPAGVHVPSRPSLTTARPPMVAHHIKPGLPGQLHTIPGMPRAVNPASTRSPSPKLLQETTTSEAPKGMYFT